MKEHVHMIGLNSIASIEIRMDFEKYVNADKTEKKQMYKDMIAVTAKLVCHQNSPLNCQILSSKIFLSQRS